MVYRCFAFYGTNYIVKIFEIVLFGGFFLHILLGIILQVKNWMSRPVRYKVNNKTTTPFLSKYMIYTGAIVLIFLVIHLMNFFFIKLGWVESPVDMLEGGEPDFFCCRRMAFHATLIFCFLYHSDHCSWLSSQSCFPGGISDAGPGA